MVTGENDDWIYTEEPPARSDDPIIFGPRWLAALREIADRTYATQYDPPWCNVPSVVRFASEIHSIARAAFDPPKPQDERDDA